MLRFVTACTANCKIPVRTLSSGFWRPFAVVGILNNFMDITGHLVSLHNAVYVPYCCWIEGLVVGLY